MNPLEHAQAETIQWQRNERFLPRWRPMLPQNNPGETQMHHVAGDDAEQQLRPFAGRITDGLLWRDYSPYHWRRFMGVSGDSPLQKMQALSEYAVAVEANGQGCEAARLWEDRLKNWDTTKPQQTKMVHDF